MATTNISLDSPLLAPDLLTRGDVRVARHNGWVVTKTSDYMVGRVNEDTISGKPIWRAHAHDLSGWSFTRNGAIDIVLQLHNLHEKAQAYDRIQRRNWHLSGS